MDATSIAGEMLDECRRAGQAARAIADVADADAIRRALRNLARAEGLRIRTAVIDLIVVVARTDAALWDDDTATMRRKLRPT